MNTLQEKRIKQQLPQLEDDLLILLGKVYEKFNDIPKQLDTHLKETWPLYVVFGESGNYHSDALKLIIDWNSLSKEIDEYVRKASTDPLMYKAVEKNKLFQFYNTKKIYFESISGNISGETLEKVNGKPSGFIHKDIETFYRYFDASIYASKDTSKENTGDSVLLYNCSPTEIYAALKENRLTGTSESLVEIVDEQSKPTGKKFAIVSLKAGEGRVGKVLKFLGSQLQIPSATPSVRNPEEEEDPRKVFSGGASVFPQNEIFNDIFLGKQILNEIEFFNALRSNLTRIIAKVGTLPELVKNLWDDFTRRIKSLTTKLYNTLLQSITQDTKAIASQYNNLISLQEKIESEVLLSEDKSKKPVEISHTLYVNVKSFVNEVEKINFHSLFGDVIQKSNTLNQNNIFQVDIEGIDENVIQGIKNKIVNDIWKNNFFNKLHNQSCSTQRVSCDPPVYIERDAFSPMLIFNSNIIALKFFQSFLNRVISQSGGMSDQKRIREEFIKLSIQISAEAIFGKNEGLPLIKFDGKKIQRLGNKVDYSSGKTSGSVDKDFKLGRFHIKKNDDGNYFVIYMYVLFDMKVEDDQVVPYYSLIELRNESGSSFTFKAEINKSNLRKDEVFK